MSDLVSTTVRGAVGILTLNDPARRNMLSAPMVDAIGAALDDLESRPELTTLVVTGAGSSFCAGAELDTLSRAADGDFSLIRHVYGSFTRLTTSPLLTIAAVNGSAVGAGMNLALAADVRVIAETARMVPRFGELRIFPGGGHTWLLARAIGQQAATLAVLQGRSWQGAAAAEAGLAAQCVPLEQLLDAAVSVAEATNDLEPEYVRRLAQVLRTVPVLSDYGHAVSIEAEHQSWSITRPAFRVGLTELQDGLQSARAARG
jgi:enoyl-CoA hydratase